jgi:hypothetical protein
MTVYSYLIDYDNKECFDLGSGCWDVLNFIIIKDLTDDKIHEILVTIIEDNSSYTFEYIYLKAVIDYIISLMNHNSLLCLVLDDDNTFKTLGNRYINDDEKLSNLYISYIKDIDIVIQCAKRYIKTLNLQAIRISNYRKNSNQESISELEKLYTMYYLQS